MGRLQCKTAACFHYRGRWPQPRGQKPTAARDFAQKNGELKDSDSIRRTDSSRGGA